VLPESLLSGDNAGFLDQQYRAWLTDPQAVDADWRLLFEGLEETGSGGRIGPSFQPRSIFNPVGRTAGVQDLVAAERQVKVVQLINAYRVRGHMEADIDPLQRREKVEHPELTLAYYGLTEADLGRELPTAPLRGIGKTATLREIVAHCRAVYCGSIGAQFMSIASNAQKQWVLDHVEVLPGIDVLTTQEERRVYRKLCDAENFEKMLHTRFPGTKRFSLEGGETLIPLLDLVIEHAAASGVDEIVIGMAHRGRLNALVNTLEKPARLIVGEFQDTGGSTQGSGDVKYHKGYSADVTTARGDTIHLSLTPNPSHLEAVDPVVEGRVRAKQDREGDVERTRCMPLLLHGDAAFSGQGLVPECLNLSELAGYTTGGTIHVIVNNQIGFTTPPHESRSSAYATGVAMMLQIPIFHVNGEDPRAVAAAVKWAVAWRQRFHRDVVLDMYCYRKHGHNEGDEPSFTQPEMYENIRSRPTPRAVYADHLERIGALTREDLDAIHRDSVADMDVGSSDDAEVAHARAEIRQVQSKGEDLDLALYSRRDDAAETHAAGTRAAADAVSPLKGLWQRFSGGTIEDEGDTGFDAQRLVELLRAASSLPDEDFKAHAKIKRLFKQRHEMIDGKRPLDWAMGEQAAWTTLLDQGYPVRISGQDCGRGTFSHRHAVIACVESGREFYPMSRLGRFDAVDSSLSEAAVLGFEVGYAFDTPDGLTMWEAQFGDFANGAQIIIDQYIVAAEQKWGRYSGIVMMLPHGYEGQGPEHSSAKLERYLQLCAQDNMQVANVTTPAQLFHLFRRQILRQVRKPLILMTPKSLLRHRLATSTLEDMAEGRFERVLGEVDALDPAGVKRVVLCSGKIYYELLTRRRELERTDVALVRVELLYPYPAAEIDEVIARYSADVELVWCQEEPRNMGAWPSYLHWMLGHLGPDRIPGYIGRRAAASPATGSNKKHRTEQAALLDAALTV